MGTIITGVYRATCSLRRTVIHRMVMRTTVIRRWVRMVIHTMAGTITCPGTTTVRTVIHTMDGTILGLGTAVHMDTRTIGDQSIETKPTRPSTYRARLLLSH